MKYLYKRLLSLLLVFLFTISAPIQSFADMIGGTGTANIPTVKPGGSGYLNNPDPIFRDYGFRVTITTARPMVESGITELSGAYTDQDLKDQKEAIRAICKNRYWELGDDGMYFWAAKNPNIKPNKGVVSSYPGDGMDISNNRTTMVKNAQDIRDDHNRLAWMCYPGIEGLDRGAGKVTPPPECNEELYKTITLADSNFANADDWFYYIKTLYGSNDYLTLIPRIINDGSNTIQCLQNFMWDTDLYTVGGGVTAQHKVDWATIGYVTTLIQFAWYAQDTNNPSTYESFKNAIWAWVCSGYSMETMPILMIEACQEVAENGRVDEKLGDIRNSNCQLVTLPYTLNAMYGTHMSAQLFAEWPEGVKGNMTAAIVQFTDFASPVNNGYMGQALGYYVAAGRVYPKWTDRAFCKLVYPTDDREASYGYAIGFTYAADSPFKSNNNPGKPTSGKVPGSFTWKLKPRGVRDLTPNEEVNESSTVYEINMSQSGVNMNNYKDWENYVNGQGKDKNKIRINIYRISEPLPNDKMATEYKRGQITSGGQSILNPVDRVVRGDLTIDNVPVIDSNTVIM